MLRGLFAFVLTRFYAMASAAHRLEVELVGLAVNVDPDVRAVEDFTVEDLNRQRVLDHALQSALQRPRAIGGI